MAASLLGPSPKRSLAPSPTPQLSCVSLCRSAVLIFSWPSASILPTWIIEKLRFAVLKCIFSLARCHHPNADYRQVWNQRAADCAHCAACRCSRGPGRRVHDQVPSEEVCVGGKQWLFLSALESEARLPNSVRTQLSLTVEHDQVPSEEVCVVNIKLGNPLRALFGG